MWKLEVGGEEMRDVYESALEKDKKARAVPERKKSRGVSRLNFFFFPPFFFFWFFFFLFYSFLCIISKTETGEKKKSENEEEMLIFHESRSLRSPAGKSARFINFSRSAGTATKAEIQVLRPLDGVHRGRLGGVVR